MAFKGGVLSLDEEDATVLGEDEKVPSFGNASGLELAFLLGVLLLASVKLSPSPSLSL